MQILNEWTTQLQQKRAISKNDDSDIEDEINTVQRNIKYLENKKMLLLIQQDQLNLEQKLQNLNLKQKLKAKSLFSAA